MKFRFDRLAVLAAAMTVAGSLPFVANGAAAAEPPPLAPIEQEHVDGQVVVGFYASADSSAAESALNRADVTLDRALKVTNVSLVSTDSGQSIEQAIATLRAQPGVRFAEPNYIYKTSATPNDPRTGDLWGLNNTGQTVNGTAGTADADIDAPEAWDLTTGSSSVVVAIVDTGIAYDHPDLAPNIWTNPGETGSGKESNGVDDDGNGYIDDWRGWDVVGDNISVIGDGDNDPRDQNMHGSHVAGTIGARGNNGIGVAGVNWQVKLMPVRVFNGEGSGTTVDLAEAFNYAGNMGADVVNYSGSGSGFSQAVLDSINNHPNTLYVAAAGNSNLDLDLPGNDAYPCEYTS
ncbi:MAG: S8 family serine peptidase, partial [Acidimicrobiales bacterium]